MTRFLCVKKNHSDMKAPREAVAALARSGLKVGSISKTLKVNRTSVYRVLKEFSSKGNVDDEPRSGRPQSSRTKKLVKCQIEDIAKSKTIAQKHGRGSCDFTNINERACS